MDRASEKLVQAFGQDEELIRRSRDKAAIAAVLVDRKGILLEDNSVAVSSFAWALPLALKRELGALGAWSILEQRLVQALTQIVRRQDENGDPLPLDIRTIQTAYRWLVHQLGLTPDLVEPPAFVLRVYHYYRAKNAPEVQLLNSFFLEDLKRATRLVESEAAPKGLRSYLGIDKPTLEVDLLTDDAALEKAVAPKMMPLARWPSPGAHPLVLLQQAAVNLARHELLGQEGLVAVNGPPGTGKTTLLRDVVAATVVDRAMAMAAFDDPEEAFTASGQQMRVGDTGFLHLYQLNPSLKGHELLVASSNNKAVENVSRELPATKAVGRNTSELNFFKVLSDNVYGPSGEASEKELREPMETWGMIAAVLGNAENRATFQRRFWWDDDRSLRLYLKSAKGDSVVREVRENGTGRIIERRVPSIVQIEKPPSPQIAKTNWRRARSRFQALKKEADAACIACEQIRETCLKRKAARNDLAAHEATIAALFQQRETIQDARRRISIEIESRRKVHSRSCATVEHSLSQRPGLLTRIFRTRRWRTWSLRHAPLLEARESAKLALDEVESLLRQADTAAVQIQEKVQTAESDIASEREVISQLTARIEAHRPHLGDRIMDEHSFALDPEKRNLLAPWLPDSLHRKREDLFIAAVDLHRAFIDAAAQKVMHNLASLMNYLNTGPPSDEERRALLGDLWSTLFMAVPLVSTTFASMDRMLGALPPGSIGWLLIDEAGQALPQAAVGAIMRAKRSIVVGDPLQIQPIVTLPEQLSAEICRFFHVDRKDWTAPEASVQALADRASTYQACFGSDIGPRRVGIPLLVHRRCQELMFGISNRLAYDGRMVHAVCPYQPGDVGAVLGQSAWFDVDGDAETKWCPAEGDVIVSLFRKLAAAGVSDPDTFIITPFRIVANEMRRKLKEQRSLATRLNIDIDGWVNSHVGTIHTFQGREAESAFLVLGAPMASQGGARAWAAATPNIFNVAVSRAKQNFYIVGSYAAWVSIGYAREFAQLKRWTVSIRRHDATATRV